MKSPDYTILPDDQLIKLISQSDEGAFNALYDRYSAALYIHAYNLLRDREESKDIIEQTFIKIWNIRESLLPNMRVSPYLYQTVKNNILNQIARQKVSSKYLHALVSFADRYTDNADHAIREKQMATIIEHEISQLPQKMRDIFELSRKQHYSNQEIATALG